MKLVQHRPASLLCISQPLFSHPCFVKLMHVNLSHINGTHLRIHLFQACCDVCGIPQCVIVCWRKIEPSELHADCVVRVSVCVFVGRSVVACTCVHEMMNCGDLCV